MTYLSCSIPAFTVTDQELIEMSKKLRDVDDNKVEHRQFRLNYQGQASSNPKVDNAKESLFSYVDPKLFNKTSYSQFMSLTDNFYRKTKKAEPRVSTEEETREIKAFLDTVLKSKPWQELYKFLKEKNHPFTAKGESTFYDWIDQLWFKHYSRSKGLVLDSSGFEHVFIGEEKHGEVAGLHNWLRIYTLERNATENFDYKGYIVTRGEVMATVKFTWNGIVKKSGSVMFGTSPEFDMALFTLCFLSRHGRQCKVELDACPLSITNFDIVQNGKVYIGTTYPTAGKLTEQCKRLHG